jgi:DNA-binding NarL/FixJ family response regulator
VYGESWLHPDVLDLTMLDLDLDGIEAARQLKRTGCRAKLVFLTVREDPDYVHAGGYVVKACLASDPQHGHPRSPLRTQFRPRQ